MNDDVIEQLAMLLGSEKADEVAAFFSGESIYIPKRSVIRKRHALIRAEYRARRVLSRISPQIWIYHIKHL